MTKLRTHYDNLKVARDAPDFVIRAAYKILSQKYHPDKNPDDARATRVMAIINQSYEVLSDPVRRKEHDDWIRRQELLHAAEALNRARERPERPQSPPIPPQWQQPEPTSTARTSRNLITVLLLSPFKLMAALIEFSPRLAGSLLLLGGLGLWSALTTPKLPPSSGPKPYQAEAPVHAASIPLVDGDCREVPYTYRKVVNGVARNVTEVVYSVVQNGVRNYVSVKPPECEGRETVSSVGDEKLRSSQYMRPAAAPNGSPWPTRAGYVKGYPIGNANGRSEVTVDNTQNDADVFVKLVSLEGETAYPVRQFYIRAGAEFTMNKVSPGQYDLRYLDLESGGMTRSESFEVKERRTETGIEYSSLTMTLYKVQDGNFQTYPLSADEF